MIFKVGDKVKVRKNLEFRPYLHGVQFVHGMDAYKGQEFIIDRIGDSNKHIFIKNEVGHVINWTWTEDMLESGTIDDWESELK